MDGRTPQQKALNAAGFTQAELARKLHIGESQVSKWLNGSRQPDRNNRQRLRRVLGAETFEAIWPKEEARG